MAEDDNSLVIAALPEKFRVLGVSLLPFSIGHYLTLARHDCAFVSEKETYATRADVILASLVCSMTFEEFEQWENAPALGFFERSFEFINGACHLCLPWMALAIGGCQQDLDLFKWGRQVGPFGLNKKAKLFRDYTEHYCKEPKYWVEKKGTATGTQWAHNLLVTLMSNLNFTRSQAINMSIREALLHFYAYAETLGSVRLMTPEEIAFTENGA